ncbi:armadillo-type protein [Globomyces pollinis-pini]|nr:armadillo-type protein [Globomyces pollinis-pini]
MDPTDEAKADLENILKLMQDKKDPNSVDSLLQALDKNETIEKRIDAAKKLAYLTQNESQAFQLLNSFLTILNNVIQEKGELRLELMRVVVHICEIPENAKDCLKLFKMIDLDQFLGSSDDISLQLGFDSLAMSISNYAKTKDFDLNYIRELLQLYYDRCHFKNPEFIQLASYKSLLKAMGNETIVLDLFRLENLGILKNLYSKSEEYKSITVALLASCFSKISKEKEKYIFDLFSSAITQLLNSKEQTSGLMALSAIFQAQPHFGAMILSKQGLLDSIIDVVEFEKESVQYFTVEALSSGCNQVEMRKAISEKASPFLIQCWRQTKSSRIQIMASLALVKLMSVNKEVETELLEYDKGAKYFSEILNLPESPISSKVTAVEALAYLSIHPRVKELIANDAKLITNLKLLAKSDDRTAKYGMVSIFSNLTAYLPQLTDEQKNVQKLHEMAKSAAPIDSLNLDKAVAERVTKLVSHNIITSLVNLKTDSANVQESIATTYLSIATEQKHRGALIQAGACRQLLKFTTSSTPAGIIAATQALAKVAITTDPNLAFKGEMASELIRPLFNLINGDKRGLAQFEGLMAITNLAGMNDNVRNRILQVDGVTSLENLQFSDHPLIRRAATEALCNLIYHPTVFADYLSSRKPHLLQIMVALSDDDDFATRRAASGAIAVLSSEPTAIPLLITQKRFFEICLHLLEDEQDELVYRASEIIKNVTIVDQKFAKQVPKDIEKLVVTLRNHKHPGIASNLKLIQSNLQ